LISRSLTSVEKKSRGTFPEVLVRPHSGINARARKTRGIKNKNMGSVTKYRGRGLLFEPTEEERKIVERAVSFGIAQARIANLIGIDWNLEK
jgi:hypothetical protein